ncbi:MAG TPA: hypothetical protein PKD91_06655, partial [Bacteroidia bacterium]|nr:hypothetical protein [Bacteroidia bacterium]
KELCDRSGIKCYLVSGFSKLNNVFDESGHTWNVIFLNKQWFQVDVTWGAGGVNRQRKYVKQYSENYFLQNPDVFLSEHYPFDPMWQLKDYPVTLKEYKKSSDFSEPNPAMIPFHYNDTISKWESMNTMLQLLTSAQRMNRFNAGNKVIEQELAFALLENGNGEFEKGNRILSELYPKNTTGNSRGQKIKPGSEEFKLKLDSAEQFFIHADFFYKQTKLSNPDENQVLQNNRKALQNNLAIVRKEISNLNR